MEDQNNFSQIINSYQKRITVTVGSDEKGNKESKTFLTNKFKTMEGLEVALLVHKEILQFLPTDVKGFDLTNLNPTQFNNSLVRLFSKTYTEDNLLCSDIDEAFKGVHAYAYLLPLALEVIEFNGFFTLLGLENTLKATLEHLKSQMTLMQVIMEYETIDNHIKTLEKLEEMEMMSQDQTSTTTPMNLEEKVTAKTKKSKKTSKTS